MTVITCNIRLSRELCKGCWLPTLITFNFATLTEHGVGQNTRNACTEGCE